VTCGGRGHVDHGAGGGDPGRHLSVRRAATPRHAIARPHPSRRPASSLCGIIIPRRALSGPCIMCRHDRAKAKALDQFNKVGVRLLAYGNMVHREQGVQATSSMFDPSSTRLPQSLPPQLAHLEEAGGEEPDGHGDHGGARVGQLGLLGEDPATQLPLSSPAQQLFGQ